MTPCLDLERLYALDATDQDDAIDYLFEEVDDALHAGHDAQEWPGVQAMLEQFDPAKATLDLSVAVLVITLAVKTKFEARDKLVAYVRDGWGDRVVKGLE